MKLVSDRVREIANLPFRVGADGFDMELAVRIMDAADRVALEKLANEHPSKAVTLPEGHMGFVPHKTKARKRKGAQG